MDANTYYANQHLQEQDDLDAAQAYAEELAQAEIEDVNGKYYPWHIKNIYEALNEIREEEIVRIAKHYADDKELSKVIREVVVGYWFDQAVEGK